MSENNDLTGYKLSRDWFDFCFENPEKIKPAHTAIYMFAIEHWNRLGQKEKFGFPSQMTMDAIGIKSYNTYIPHFNDLVNWGFFNLIERSKNQYSSNIIGLSKINKAPDKAPDKALDKAMIKHKGKQLQSKCSIDKQINNRTIEQRNKEQEALIEISNIGTNGVERVNGCPVPKSLQDESIIDAYNFYCQYMKENYSRWPTSTTTQMDLHKLTELQHKGHDPVAVISQTIQSRNKSFYELKGFGKKSKQIDPEELDF